MRRLVVAAAGLPRAHLATPSPRGNVPADPPAPPDGFGVVITGATKGFGYAIAREFLARGDRVCICSRSQTRVDLAVAALRREFPGSCVSGVVCDVTDPRDVDRLGDYAAATVGVIHHWQGHASASIHQSITVASSHLNHPSFASAARVMRVSCLCFCRCPSRSDAERP